MKTRTRHPCSPSLAASVAPEDLHLGDDVAVLNETSEHLSCLWRCEPTDLDPRQPVEVVWRSPEAGAPLRIKAICLPFVLVRTVAGTGRTLDIRQVQLVRLDRNYARLARKELKQQGKEPVADDAD